MKGCKIMFPPASEFKSSLFQKLLTLAFWIFSFSAFLSTPLSWCGESANKTESKIDHFYPPNVCTGEHTALNYDTFLPRDTHALGLHPDTLQLLHRPDPRSASQPAEKVSCVIFRRHSSTSPPTSFDNLCNYVNIIGQIKWRVPRCYK